MRTIKLIFGILLLSYSVVSQTPAEDRLQAYLIAMEEDSLVRIRWAPVNMKSWNWGIEYGYRLSRYTVAIDGVRDSLQGQINSLVVLDSVILPLPENQFNSTYIDATTNQINLAKGAIYEPAFVIDSMIGESEFIRAFAHESDMESRFTFGLFGADQTFEIAKAMGLGFLDDDVDSLATYFYRIEFLGDPDSTTLTASGITIDLREDMTLPNPSTPVKEMAVDTTIFISWDITYVAENYSSYNIERSEDSINFTRINELPLVPGGEGVNESTVYYTDKVEEIGAWYWYRVRGVNNFGQEGPPSGNLKVKTSPSPKAPPPKITDLTLVAEDVQVEWTYPDTLESLISQFKIYRSNNAIGPFIQLDSVAANLRTWTDEDPLPSNYYRVTAHDLAPAEVRAGDKFIQLNDTIPPAVPNGIICSVNDEGYVTVSWTPVDDPGLKGYRVFSGNGDEGNFGEETTTATRDTFYSFLTNLNTLTKDVYVKVQALDVRENHSDYSSSCLTQRPDLIAPSKPLLFRCNPLPDGVYLEWKPALEEDLSRHEIQRKKDRVAGWTTIVALDVIGDTIGTPIGVMNLEANQLEGNLLDTVASYPDEYQYRVLAYDSSNNVSSSEIMYVRPYDSGARGIITELDADSIYIDQITGSTNRLTWQYNSLQGLFDFQIYRSVDGKPMRAYSTTNGRGGVNFGDKITSGDGSEVEPGIFIWKDPDLGNATMLAQSGFPAAIPGQPLNRTFRYQIMARHFDGGWSPMSEVVEIEVWVSGN